MTTSTVLASRLDKVQSFQETTWGSGPDSAHAITSRWMGVKPRPEFKAYKKQTLFDEQRGSLAPAFFHAQLRDGGEFKIPMIATYEDILYPLFAALGILSSPGGTGPTYTWAWTTAPTTAAWNVQSYTLEWGYSASQSVLANGCTTTKFSVKGEAMKEWEVSMEGFYKTHTQTNSMTGSINDRTVEAIITPTTICTIDATGASIGTTPMANSLVSFTLEWETGLKPVFVGGSLSPVSFTYEKLNPVLTLGLLYNATTLTALSSMMAGNRQLCRVSSTSGTKVAQFDMAGVLSDDPAFWPDKEGAKMFEVKLAAEYDSGLGAYLAASITNGVASLP